MATKNFITILLLIYGSILLTAQNNIYMVNYGPDAELSEGDDDFFTVYYFGIPENYDGDIFLRFFDMDCSNEYDQKLGNWDTQTEFSLYGGDFISDYTNLNVNYFEKEHLQEGALIKSISTGYSPEYENKWFNFPALDKTKGKYENGMYIFKIVVRTITGDDGNIYDFFVSTNPDDNEEIKGVKIFTYKPSIRLQSNNVTSSLSFQIPEDSKIITIHNFDADGASLHFNTPFRSNIKLGSSPEGSWKENIIEVGKYENGLTASINFNSRSSIANDITLFILDGQNNPVPLDWPLYSPYLNNTPVISYYSSPTNNCNKIVFDASATYDPDVDNLIFTWLIDGDTVSTEPQFEYTFSDTDTHSIALIVIDESKYQPKGIYKEFDFKVNESPIAKINGPLVAAPGENILLSAEDSYDPDGTISNYIWNIEGTNIFSKKRLFHSFESIGVKKVALLIEDNSDTPCRYASDTLLIKVNAPPFAVAGNDTSISPNEPLLLNAAKSSDPDGKIIKYIWQVDNKIIEGDSIVYTFNSPGIYNVELTIEDDGNVSNSKATEKLTVSVNASPVPISSFKKIAAPGRNITFDASGSYDKDGKIISYTWIFGDKDTLAGETVLKSFELPGKYEVKLLLRDNSGTTSDYSEVSSFIIINSTPVASAGTDIISTKKLIQFSGSGSYDQDGDISSYKWDFGDGTTSNEINPKHTYREAGNYNVVLTVTDNSDVENSISTSQINVIINARPIADAGPDIFTSPGKIFSLSAANSFDPDGEIMTYEWQVGDSVISEKSFNYAILKPGKFNINLKVTDNTGDSLANDYDDLTVYVNSNPIAIINGKMIASPNEDITFSASESYDMEGAIKSFNWYIDDKTFTGSKINYAFSSPGFYPVLLAVEDNQNADNSISYDTLLVKINSSPIPKINFPTQNCNTFITFDASLSVDPDGDPLLFTWNFGDGSEDITGAIVSHDFSSAGIYPVKLTIDDDMNVNNSITIDNVICSINHPPISDAGEDMVACVGKTVFLSGASSHDIEEGVMKYYWDFGNGKTAEGINATTVYNHSGTYEVTLKVEDNSGTDCNTDIDTKLIRVIDSPVANAGQDITACTNSVVNFNGSLSTDIDGIVNTFDWDFGDGSTGGGATPFHIYTSPGVYTVTLTISGEYSGECLNTDSDQIKVTIYEAPYSSITSKDSCMSGDLVSFYASNINPDYNYLWTIDGDSLGNSSRLDHRFTKGGNYKIRLITIQQKNPNCSTSFFEKNIYVNESPIAIAGDDIKGGVGELITFDASKSYDPDGKITRYVWYLDNRILEGKTINYSFKESGVFKVILEVFDNTFLEGNCAKDTIVVTINSAPRINISAPQFALVNETITLDASSSYDSDGKIIEYKWYIPGKDILEGKSVNYSFDTPGNYNISLRVKDNSKTVNSFTENKINLVVIDYPKSQLPDIVTICRNDELDLIWNSNFKNDYDLFEIVWHLNNNTTYTGNELIYQNNNINSYYIFADLYWKGNNRRVLETDSIKIIINSPPVVYLPGDYSITLNTPDEPVLFDASESYDPDGDLLYFQWDFGDGSSASGIKLYHLYKSAGTYRVTLTVSDNSTSKCNAASKSFHITVNYHK